MRFSPTRGGAGSAGLLALALAYPLIAYIALHWLSPLLVAGGLVGVAGLRLLVQSRSSEHRFGAGALGVAALGVALLAPFDGVAAIKLYPIAVSLGFAAIFAWTLIRPPSAIERIARLWGSELDERGIAYTRKVTTVWIGFFLLNAAISAWTAGESLETWTLYNGFLSYVLTGALFLAEYVVRQRLLRSMEPVS